MLNERNKNNKKKEIENEKRERKEIEGQKRDVKKRNEHERIGKVQANDTEAINHLTTITKLVEKEGEILKIYREICCFVWFCFVLIVLKFFLMVRN